VSTTLSDLTYLSFPRKRGSSGPCDKPGFPPSLPFARMTVLWR